MTPKYACILNLVVNLLFDIWQLYFSHDMSVMTKKLMLCYTIIGWPKLWEWGGGWEWGAYVNRAFSYLRRSGLVGGKYNLSAI